MYASLAGHSRLANASSYLEDETLTVVAYVCYCTDCRSYLDISLLLITALKGGYVRPTDGRQKVQPVVLFLDISEALQFASATVHKLVANR